MFEYVRVSNFYARHTKYKGHIVFLSVSLSFLPTPVKGYMFLNILWLFFAEFYLNLSWLCLNTSEPLHASCVWIFAEIGTVSDNFRNRQMFMNISESTEHFWIIAEYFWTITCILCLNICWISDCFSQFQLWFRNIQMSEHFWILLNHSWIFQKQFWAMSEYFWFCLNISESLHASYVWTFAEFRTTSANFSEISELFRCLNIAES